jgi:DNA polymerase-3 subunit delta'
VPWPLIGNDAAVRILSRAVDNGSVQHAYIFAGPEQTGRRTAALLLAQALNCTTDSRPCGECTQCHRISAGNHADIRIVEIEESTDGPAHKEIGVDQLREIERAVALNPYEGRTRVVIIDPADVMSTAAQNAFLKTLEEPPAHVLIVLITSDERRLLETVRSRCARVLFRLVPVSEIEAALTGRGTEPDRAQLLARLSGGRPGWAIRAADDARFFEARRESLDAARSLPQMPLPDRIDLAEKLSENFRQDRQAVHNRINGWLDWWRDVVLVQSGADDSVANSDRVADLREDAGRWPGEEVLAFVRSLIATSEYLTANVQPKIALDALMLDVPGGAESATRHTSR